MLHDDRAHENLDGAHILQWDLALASGLDQSEGRAELLLRDGAGSVNLVSENQEGNTLELLDGKESIQLSLGLQETLAVLAINQEDNAVDFGEVILPDTAGLLMSTEIKGSEFDVGDRELLRGGVESGLESGQTVVLQHVKQGGLSGIIKTEEEDLGVLVEQT